MSDSLLTTVQDFCGEQGLPIPTAVMGVTDLAVAQYRSIMKRVVTELGQWKWEQQSIRTTFTSIADENQGALTTIIGPDYDGLVQSSVWDETLKRPLPGPVTDASWEMLKAFTNTGPLYQYRISQGNFLTNPALPAGHTIGLVYRSKYGVTSAAGTPKASFTADDDLILFPDVCVAAALKYRWLKVKGEEWETVYNEFLGLVAKNIVKDTAAILQLDGRSANLRPGIWVPAGNWP
jgi:hypothetical protein